MRIRNARLAGAARLRGSVLLIATLALVFDSARGEVRATTHDRAFWVGLRAAGFKLPQEQSTLPLALEAATLLGSTDPELRDAIGYEAIETWVYREQRLDPGELEQLRVTLATNARRGLGAGAGDGLFLRSFSVLSLAVLAAQDLKRSYLGARQFDELVDLGVEELRSERDLRGYVPGKGWGHATAHCADLLKFLARNPRLQAAQQARIVNSIAERLRSAGQVFVWGEDDRLAAALTSIATRSDAEAGPFNAWFKRLAEEHAALWSGAFDPSRYVPVRAQLNALNAFAADLDAASGPATGIRSTLRSLRSETQ
jgi:Protein of unknown function (DUF2785)